MNSPGSAGNVVTLYELREGELIAWHVDGDVARCSRGGRVVFVKPKHRRALESRGAATFSKAQGGLVLFRRAPTTRQSRMRGGVKSF